MVVRVYLPKLKKGVLAKYGYKNVDSLTLKQRRIALKKALKRMKPLKLYHRLNAVRVLHTNTNPHISRIFKADANWVKKNYLKK